MPVSGPFGFHPFCLGGQGHIGPDGASESMSSYACRVLQAENNPSPVKASSQNRPHSYLPEFYTARKRGNIAPQLLRHVWIAYYIYNLVNLLKASVMLQIVLGHLQ